MQLAPVSLASLSPFLTSCFLCNSLQYINRLLFIHTNV